MRKILGFILLVSFILISVSEVFAHSGRTDRRGCHYDRRTGVYHCH